MLSRFSVLDSMPGYGADKKESSTDATKEINPSYIDADLLEDINTYMTNLADNANEKIYRHDDQFLQYMVRKYPCRRCTKLYIHEINY